MAAIIVRRSPGWCLRPTGTSVCAAVRLALAGLVSLLLLTACSSTSLGLRFLYSRFDNTLNERILSYADFDPGQEQEIREAVDAYVTWHRRNELPRYADFIEDLRVKIESGKYSVDTILGDIRRLRSLSDRSFLNSPVVTAPEFLQGLSDAQVAQVGAAFERREARYRERRRERLEEGPDAALDRVVRTVGRAGIKLNPEQRAIVARGLERYRWQPERRRAQWRQWERAFLALLQNRHRPGSSDQIKQHLATYHEVPRNADPHNDAWNQRNSARIVYEILRSLDSSQKRLLVKRLGETRRVLLDISGEKSS